MNSIEATVIELWNKGLTIQDIAGELYLEEDVVQDMLEINSEDIGDIPYYEAGDGHH